MHKLLQRQIKRYVDSGKIPDTCLELFDAVGKAYLDFDSERELLERSLSLVSEELNQSNEDLRKKLQQLESTFNQLSESASVLDGILNATGEAIVALDQSGRLVRFNAPAKLIFTFLSPNPDASKNLLLRPLLKLLKNSSTILRELKKLTLDDKATLYGTLDFKDGRWFEYHSRAQVQDGAIAGRVWCFREVTKIKENEALVEHLAFHDSLTHLPNRLLFLDRLNHAISLATRQNSLLGILFIDLDHFKKVNDTAGHQCGDELLIEVSARISGCLREHDTLSRFGGDEFVVLLENIRSHRIAALISRRIIDQLTLPFYIEDKTFHISSSIGVTIYPKDGLEPEELIRKADLAMYHAKDKGRSNFEFFNTALERFAHFQLELENRLREAVREQSFEIVYQPQVETKHFKVTSMEALIRWIPKLGKPVSPAEFIPVAERIGLVSEIDYWVMTEVCKQIKSWIEMGAREFRVAVNLSAHQLTNGDLVAEIRSMLAENQVDGKYLEFEITESMLLQNMDKAIDVLHGIRELGIMVAIDDFGTGYSSLQYLQKLPIDGVKIDRSFIHDFEQNRNNQAIVNTIISLGHNLELSVIAEGVEEQSSVDFLREKKCDYIQGYYFYKPLPLAEVTELLLEQSGVKRSHKNISPS